MGIVPISKSIWPPILFVCVNLHFAALIRFNLFSNFSLLFFREPSKALPPNFAPPFCALCLNVCDFLPKTWDLGRKKETSPSQAGHPFRLLPLVAATFPKGTAEPSQSSLLDASPLGDGAFGMAMKFPAKVQSSRARQRLPPRGSWQSRQALSEGVRLQTPPVKRQIWKIRRFSRFAKL